MMTDLELIEQSRLQMAAISSAAMGYWIEGDNIHPDYVTPALRDVVKLYAKYEAMREKPWVGLTLDDLPSEQFGDAKFLAGARWAEAMLKEKNT